MQAAHTSVETGCERMISTLAGLRLLVLEDETLIAFLLQDLLSDLGCVVIGPAGNVRSALAQLQTDEIDAAILDINLGGGERSYPVADMLTARKTPFVFITGYGAGGVEERYKHIPVLQKPFSNDDLKRILCQHLLPGCITKL